MNKKAISSLHLIVGVLIVTGGLLYLFNHAGLGLITATIGLLVEAIINWVGKMSN